ncbi:class I SAM-dependent methyltransferase [Fulvivirga sp. 29W222]|uniref:Class I SAM-dependent methyltransferase n=1 Tax=Fulvivirga marina TaxID=2494733 RepID=A0A937KCH4_9BACT|nr:class I SAM-dependent methyltransferase [Fulvivirga marina]MBL6447527.1 class I SAM-dependent methyltransferase [Fulvivirga marina]
MHYSELNKAIGNIDIYLLDQILKGRFEGKKRLLDAGCGEGRNMTYFLNNGYDVYGVDSNPLAVRMLHMMHKAIPKDHFLEGKVERLPWKDYFFDAIICSAVLHFAPDRDTFFEMIKELKRVLNQHGILFIRMASTLGMEKSDNDTFSYLLTPEDISTLVYESGFEKVEPIKTVLVEGQRSMATLVLAKS